MKRDCWPPVPLLKHGREQVLSGVLLHVVKAARPVDAAEDVRAARAAVDDMNDFVARVAHVEYIRVPDFSLVVWLASRGWIESGAVQNQAQDLRGNSSVHVRGEKFAMQDPRGELFLECVVVIDPMCLHKVGEV